MKNPFIISLRNIFIYYIVWAVVMAAHAFFLIYYYNLGFFPAIIDSLVFNLLFAEIILGVWYTIRYLKIDQSSTLLLFLNHTAIAIVFFALWLLSAFFILQLLLGENNTYMHFLSHTIPYRLITGILFYLLTVLVYYLFMYYHSFKDKLTRESSLRTLVKETELSLLKSQINPHFIFNTLNSISSLTITNPPLAQEMVVKLSSFLRYALDKTSKNLVSFSEELENASLYIDIEKTRFGDKLIFHKDIGTDCLSLQLPNLIIQPLLENAVKYGVYESTTPVTIHMTAVNENGFLRIVIRNNYDAEAVTRKGKGIGLKNVKERLYLIYGQRELITISSDNSIFEVSLFVPQSAS